MIWNHVYIDILFFYSFLIWPASKNLILLLLIKLQDYNPSLAITLFQTSNNSLSLQEIAIDHNNDESMQDLC